MKTFVGLALLALATVNALPSQPRITQLFDAHQEIHVDDLPMYSQFTDFAERHQKQYNDRAHVLERFTVYKANHAQLLMWQQQEQGTAVYGETQFMDLTSEEFHKIYLPAMNEDPQGPACKIAASNSEPPAAFDWREKEGVVTGVKNQGSCGSCWAFSVVGNIEGQWKLRRDQAVSLSEQELLDCDTKDQACNGGYPVWAYEEIERLGGLETETEYPYHSRKSQCTITKDKLVANITDFCQVEKNEETIKQYLVEHGPLSIAVNANPLQFYFGGIHHPWKIFCSPKGLNHAVLLVGYGQEGKKPFWIIKNSWGTGWGEKGYYRLYRGENVCGVSEMVTTALIN